MAWTLEQLKAEKERRKAMPEEAKAKPSGAPAAGTGDTSLEAIAAEVGSGYGRGYLGGAESALNTITALPRALGNKVMDVTQEMGLHDNPDRITDINLTQFTDDLGLEGGQMGDTDVAAVTRTVSEAAPETLAMLAGGAGLTKATGKALGRGAARVLGRGPKPAQAARGPAVSVEQTAAQVARANPGVKATEPLIRSTGGAAGVAATEAPSRLKGAAQGGAAAAALGGDASEIMGGSALGAMFASPATRWVSSRLAGRMFGDKARAATYVASHPASRRQAQGLAKAIRKKWKGE